jgi:hypothetical protein
MKLMMRRETWEMNAVHVGKTTPIKVEWDKGAYTIKITFEDGTVWQDTQMITEDRVLKSIKYAVEKYLGIRQ